MNSSSPLPSGERGVRRNRHARAALMWGLAAFVLLQGGLGLAIDRGLPQLRDPFPAYRLNRLARRAAGADRPLTVVVLGSSRVQMGLRSADLERRVAAILGRPALVFNFGIPGAGPVANLLHLRRLLARGVRPDLLFVEVLPVCLAHRDPEPIEASALKVNRLWLDELPLLARYDIPAGQQVGAWWVSCLLPTWSHRFPILSRLAPTLLPGALRLDWARHLDDSGWQETPSLPIRPAWRWEQLTREWQGHGLLLQHFEPSPALCRAVDDLLALCRREGIRPVLLWMPESSEYRGWYPPAVRDRLDRLLAGLRHRHGVPLVDARAWVADAGFRDGQHLIPAGARTFTERFGRQVVLPALTSIGRQGTE